MFHIHITVKEIELSLKYFCREYTIPYEFYLQILLFKEKILLFPFKNFRK